MLGMIILQKQTKPQHNLEIDVQYTHIKVLSTIDYRWRRSEQLRQPDISPMMTGGVFAMCGDQAFTSGPNVT